MLCSSLLLKLPLPQEVFLNLAGRCLRKFRYKLDSLGALESGQLLPAIRILGCRVEHRTRRQNDERLRDLSKPLMRAGNHGDVQYGGVRADDALDLER